MKHGEETAGFDKHCGNRSSLGPSPRWLQSGNSGTGAGSLTAGCLDCSLEDHGVAMAFLKVGDQAPDFTLQTHDGKSLSLCGLRGKKVLIWFYPKADTPGCTVEGNGFCFQYQEFADRDIAVLGVSFDSVEDNAAFAKKFGFQYPLLCDTERALGLAYGACDSAKARYASRISYLIDEQGKIAKVYAQVNPREHAGEVLADLTPD